MCAAFDDIPLRKHDDLVGMNDGAEPVGDDDRRASDHEPVDGLLNEAFRFGVERAGRLVEYQDFRILQDGSCDRQSLAFAAGELRSSIAYHRIEIVGEFLDESPRVGGFRCLDDPFFGPLGMAVSDVRSDGVVEEDDLLRNDSHQLAQAGYFYVAKVGSIEQDATFGRVVEPRDEVGQRGFARTRRPDQGDYLSLRDREVDIGQRRLVRSFILERDILEDDRIAQILHVLRVRFFDDDRRRIHKLENSFCGGEAGIDASELVRERFDGLHYQKEHDHILHEGFRRQTAAGYDLSTREPQNANGDRRGDNLVERPGEPPHSDHLQNVAQVVVGKFREPPQLERRHVERLDHANAGNRFLQDADRIGHPLLTARCISSKMLSYRVEDQGDNRYHRRDYEGQFPVEEEQDEIID